MIKNWKQYNEALKDDLADKLKSSVEFKQAIIEMIEKSINSSDIKVFQEFIDSYLKDPDKTNIEGLINDSDVWDFYSKWTNEIDEILDKVKWFDEIPSENNSYGVYDFVIKSTKRAVKEAIADIKEEALKSNEMFNFINIFKKKDKPEVLASNVNLGKIILVDTDHKDDNGRRLTHVYQITKDGGIFIGNLRTLKLPIFTLNKLIKKDKTEKLESYRDCNDMERHAIMRELSKHSVDQDNFKTLVSKTGYDPRF
jgi:hypothetical protein